MNKPIVEDSIANTAAACCAEVDECVRRHPGTTLLVAAFAGLAIGMLVRPSRHESTSQHRIAKLMKDLECRLREAAEPAARKGGAFVRERAGALHDGLHKGEAGIEGLLREARRRFRKLLP